MTNLKPRVRVVSGGALAKEQIIDAQAAWFYHHLMQIDSDAVLKKAGIRRTDLEKLLSDPEIEQAINRRHEEFDSAKFTLTPSEGAAARFVFEQLEIFLPDILTAAMNSKWYGYDVAEMTWGDGGGKNTVNTFVSKPIEWFDITNKGKVKWFPNNGANPITLSDQADFDFKFLVQRHKPSYKHPKGQALLSRVYWLWYFKFNAWRFWSKYLEKHGSPTLVGKGGNGTEEDANAFANALLAAHSSGVVVVGKDEDVVALNPGNNGEAFINYTNANAKQITTYLLGQTLTSGIDGGGTYGQAVVHQQQQDIIFNSDRNHAKKAVQRFINLICWANGFEPPTFEWVSSNGLQQERATRDKDLFTMGWRPTRAYFADYYDMENHHFYLVDEVTPLLSDGNTKGLKGLQGTPKPVDKVKFTAQQQALEDIADGMLVHHPPPLPHAFDIIVNAKDEDDLKEKLLAACGHLEKDEFRQMMEAALMVADMRGYADNEDGA